MPSSPQRLCPLNSKPRQAGRQAGTARTNPWFYAPRHPTTTAVYNPTARRYATTLANHFGQLANKRTHGVLNAKLASKALPSKFKA